MQSGTLRNRVAIQLRNDTQDSYGQPLPAWVTLATVWMEKRDLSGRELESAQALHGETTTEFVMRYLDGFDQTARLLHDGAVYAIHAVLDPEGRKRTMRLHCSRGVNDG